MLPRALFLLLLATSLAPACTQDEATACGKGTDYHDGACFPEEPTPVTPTGSGGEGGQAPAVVDPAFGTPCSSVDECDAPTDYCVPHSPFDDAYCSVKGCDEDASICPPDWTCTNVGMFMTGEPYACTRPF
jgi:hypothetical protein